MNYLLDTQVLIYIGCGHENKIGRSALKIYKDNKSKIYISQISFWELAIKINIGKLHIPIGLKNIIMLSSQAGVEMIPIENSHILHYQDLDVKENHKDPFDRFMVSVSLCENLKILSNDRQFDLYKGIKRIWD